MKQGSNERWNAANGHRCQTTLGEVTDSAIQQAVPDCEFVYLDIGSVDRESKHFNDLRVISPNDAPSRARQVVKQGDVLVSMTRPNLNAVAMVPDRGDYFIASTGFHALRSHWVDPKYLYYLVQSEAFIEAMSAVVQGALYPAVRPKDIAGFEFELPPQREQTRIVEKLEELLSDLNAGVEELKAAQRKLAKYRQSLLKAINAAGYPTVSLGELVESISQGWSPRCDREPALNDDEWAVIKTTAIQPLSFDGAHNKRLPPSLDPREHLELKVGDLLVTRAGPRSRVGITCLVRKTRPRLILCDKAYRIRCDEAKINTEFLELVLNAPQVVHMIDSIKSGINDSGLNLTQDRFFTLPIPLPTIPEQLELIDRLSLLTQSILDQELAIVRALKQSDAQRKNILKAAFNGQLVPQDPTDEPASALLERIRTERANEIGIGKSRGRKPRTTA